MLFFVNSSWKQDSLFTVNEPSNTSLQISEMRIIPQLSELPLSQQHRSREQHGQLSFAPTAKNKRGKMHESDLKLLSPSTLNLVKKGLLINNKTPLEILINNKTPLFYHMFSPRLGNCAFIIKEWFLTMVQVTFYCNVSCSSEFYL